MVAVITGSNTGIGYETAKTLVVKYGWDVVLACRSKDKALQAQTMIEQEQQQQKQQIASGRASARASEDVGKVVVLDPVLDLSDFDSIRQYVKSLQEKYGGGQRGDGDGKGIDVLINNAGRNTSGPPSTTVTTTLNEGNVDVQLDLMFQSNYLGHYLLTKLLLDGDGDDGEGGDDSSLLRRNGGGTVINVSSVMHHFAGSGIESRSGGRGRQSHGQSQADPISTREYWLSHATSTYGSDVPPNPGVYSASKLAAILHAIEIQNRYSRNNNTNNNNDDSVADGGSVNAIVVNPGSVASDIWRHFPSWIRSIFKQVYLSPQQGSTTILAAALLSTSSSISSSTSTRSSSSSPIMYLQPYWIPPFIIQEEKDNNSPLLPFMEMLGPYAGYVVTAPRLPSSSSDTDIAAKTLWELSNDLTSSASSLK
jgi:NAD(P)-dependent dehydrogenase (short-subunit alcohol dehydrogenase family)